MGVQLNESLVRDVNRLPGPPLVNPRGNFRTSNFRVPLLDLSVSQNLLVATQAVIANADIVAALLFLQDFPADVRCVSKLNAAPTLTGGGGDALVWWIPTFLERVRQLGSVVALYSQLLSGPNHATALAGENVSGVTTALGVPVSGYPIEIAVADRDLVDDAADPIPYTLMLRLRCQADIVEGGPGTGNIGFFGFGTVFPSVTPCLLNASDYTAAIKAAGNVVTLGNGTILMVLGIYAIENQG